MIALLLLGLTATETATTCRLLLVRHGETDYNKEGRLQGRLESVLSPKGQGQARKLGEWFKQSGEKIDSVFVSSRMRARQTLVNIKNLNMDLPGAEVREGLREIELTVWEGQLKNDIRNGDGEPDTERWQQWKAHPDGFVFEEDGHSPLGDLTRRAEEEWKAMVDEATVGTTTLVVAHGAFNRVFMQVALGLAVDDVGFHDERFDFENCATVELEWEPGQTLATRWRKRYPTEWSGDAWSTREAEHERRAEIMAGRAERGESKQEL